MKKLALVGLLAISAFAGDKILSQNEVLNILKPTYIYNKNLKKALKSGLKLKGLEKKDFYVITFGNSPQNSIFISKNGKYIILGRVLNASTGHPLQISYPNTPFTGNKEVVKNGIVFTFGKGKKDLYIVTDPECPFCRRFEKIAEKNHLADKYKIHIIFLPLSFHKNSKDMIYYILSAKNDMEKAKRFKETLEGSEKWKSFKPTKEQKENIDKIIAKSVKAADELGAEGTPSFYDKDMKEIKDRESIFK